MADKMDSVFSLENPIFKSYLFYCSVLVVKTMIMSVLTARQRFKHKAFANPEDVAGTKAKPREDENVERVRRAHLNDLENIPLFFVVAFCYIMTNPVASTATLLFRVYTVARILHTMVYAVFVIPQPARVTCWTVGYLITGYMAFACLKTFY